MSHKVWRAVYQSYPQMRQYVALTYVSLCDILDAYSIKHDHSMYVISTSLRDAQPRTRRNPRTMCDERHTINIETRSGSVMISVGRDVYILHDDDVDDVFEDLPNAWDIVSV